MTLLNQDVAVFLKNSFNNPDSFPDFKIKFLDDTTLLAHKCVLAGNSDYFKAMFTNGMAESQSNTVVIEDDKITVTLLLEALYTGELKAPITEQIIPMVALAAKYQLPSCEKILIDHLQSHITMDTAVQCMELDSTREEYAKLIKTAKDVVQRHAAAILQGNTFLTMDIDKFHSLLDFSVSQNSLVQAYSALDSWIEHDEANRAGYSRALLKLINSKNAVKSALYNRWDSKHVLCTNYSQNYEFTNDNKTVTKSLNDGTITIVRTEEPIEFNGCTKFTFVIDNLVDGDFEIGLAPPSYNWDTCWLREGAYPYLGQKKTGDKIHVYIDQGKFAYERESDGNITPENSGSIYSLVNHSVYPVIAIRAIGGSVTLA
jgi:hypothetical protein